MKKIWVLGLLLAATTMSVCGENKQTVSSDKGDSFGLFKRYYKRSGVSYVSLVSAGYSTNFLLPKNPMGYDIAEFTGRQHFLNISFVDFRVHFVGAELLDFEFGVNTPGPTKHGVNLGKTGSMGGSLEDPNHEYIIDQASLKSMWFAWKPCVKFYVPATNWLAAEAYVGAFVDITGMWNKMCPGFYTGKTADAPERNHFVGGFGGIGLLFAGPVAVPMELKCEYRCPSKGNKLLMPEGFYLGLQLHIGWMLNNKGKVMNK